jgi:hypothetical protein
MKQNPMFSVALVLLTAGVFFTFGLLPYATAGTGDAVSGFAWSENIGWISFNCTSTNSCASVDYGVDIDAQGNFSGFAWSENIGWIKFDPTTTSPGAPNHSACLDLPSAGQACDGVGNNLISGWARACVAVADKTTCEGAADPAAGGWDGWIKLRCNGTECTSSNYGVSWNSGTSEMEGWAWSDRVVGWVSFNCLDAGVCASSNYKVVAAIDVTSPRVTSFSASSPIPQGGSTTISWTVTDSGGSNLKWVQVWRTSDSGGAPNPAGWVQVGPNHNVPAGSNAWLSSTTDSPPNGAWWYGLHIEDNATNQATESDPPAVGQKKVIVNSPPTPGNSTDPGFTSSSAITNTGSGICSEITLLQWLYSDSDGNPQQAAQVQIDETIQGNFSSPVEDRMLGAITSIPITHGNDTGPSDGRLPFAGSWVWRVRVQDSLGVWSNWVQDDSSFSTILHDFPIVQFTFTPSKPSAGEPIQFADQSQTFGGASILSRPWQLLFDGNPSSSTIQNPSVRFSSSGEKRITLNITDSDNLSCAIDTQTLSPGDPSKINIKAKLPKFFPVIPF